MAKLIITTTESEKQKGMQFLCVWHSESEHMVCTSPSDCVVGPVPFCRKHHYGKHLSQLVGIVCFPAKALSPEWMPLHWMFYNNLLPFHSWAYTHMHISRRPTSELCDLLNISKQATWSCDSKYLSYSTIKQGSSFSMILYRECCNIYCLNKLQNQKIKFI